MLQEEIEQLKSHFLHKHGGVLSGSVKPNQTDTHNLGEADRRWNVIYARQVIADEVQGGTGGEEAINADTVDGFHAQPAGSPTPNALLALDPQGVFPVGVYPEALLKDGSRALEGSLAVVDGATIDGVDIDRHDHSGGGAGVQLLHGSLLGLDADDHPQYTQRAQDEIITGDWMFTHLEDRSAGWQFLPDEKVFKAVPHNLVLKATENEASIGLGEAVSGQCPLHLYSDNQETYMRVGTGAGAINLHSTHPTHRLWTGDGDPGSAPFQIEADGSIVALDGLIGGWRILPDRIYSGNLELSNLGRITAGEGNNVAVLDAYDPDWRFWIGDADAPDAAFRVRKTGQLYMNDAYVTGTLRSTNFQSGQTGFSVDSTGLAEFDNIIARGKIMASVFAEATVSVASGRLMLTDGAVLIEDVSADQDYIIVDAPVFLPNDIIQLKPDKDRDEYMRISSPYQVVTVDGRTGFKHFVVRGLNSSAHAYTGPYSFYAGENAFRHGTSTVSLDGHPLAAGVQGGEYGEFLPGGSAAISQGGYLILEGSRYWGPYFGVVARFGPVYDQELDVVRIGNLKGILDYPSHVDEWGAFFGDANDFFAYDRSRGLRIITRGGDTAIDKEGIRTDLFALAKVDAAPAYEADRAKLYLDADAKLKVRIKEGLTQTESALMLASVYDPDGDGKVASAANADNAQNAANASSVPWSGVTGKPSTFTPSSHTHPGNQITSAVANATNASNADTVDGIDSSRIVYGDGNKTTNSASSMNEALPSGFYNYYNPTGKPPDNGWYFWIHTRHHSTGNNYAMQLAAPFEADNFYLRRIRNGTAQSWRRIALSGDVYGVALYRTTAVWVHNTYVPFTNVSHDSGGFWNSGAPTRITIPETGFYIFGAELPFRGYGTDWAGYIAIVLNRSGGTVCANHFRIEREQRRNCPNVMGANWLSAGSYLEVYLALSAGVNVEPTKMAYEDVDGWYEINITNYPRFWCYRVDHK